MSQKTRELLSSLLKGRKKSSETISRMSASKKERMSGIPKNILSEMCGKIRRGHKNHKSSSRYLGVTHHNGGGRNQRWCAFAYISKSILIGRYTTELDAARAYNVKMIEVYKDKAILNDIPGFSYENYKSLIKKRTVYGKIKYRGVTLNRLGSYQVKVFHRGYIGLYHSAEEAARAYDNVAKEVFGDKAKLNFPEQNGNVVSL